MTGVCQDMYSLKRHYFKSKVDYSSYVHPTDANPLALAAAY